MQVQVSEMKMYFDSEWDRINKPNRDKILILVNFCSKTQGKQNHRQNQKTNLTQQLSEQLTE